MGPVAAAQRLAEFLLVGSLPGRWRHVRSVAAKAARVVVSLDAGDRPVVVAAAWLHDVGYAPGVADTGFHPLDGARWLRRRGFDERVVRLVAHHSFALVEAEERGLDRELSREFEREESAVSDALLYCDLTTGPDGQDFTLSERLTEARMRYGPGHVVTRFLDRAEPRMAAAIQRAEQRMGLAARR